MLIAVCSGFLLALLVPWLHRILGREVGWVVALLAAGIAVYFGSLLPTLGEAHGILSSYAWAEDLGLRLSFRLDGLSSLFAILISSIGAVVAVYTRSYMGGHASLGIFYAYLLIFMASMLGLVLADNLLLLVIFWELTTISSYLLIGFEHQEQASRQAALQALLVTAAGGLALLAGAVLLNIAGDTWEISALAAEPDAIAEHPLYLPILLLVLTGAATKSAQFPFHFWLPAAMQAPTPVSAYLHSAAMVKAGVYLLARLHPILGGDARWMGIITPIGAITMLLGAWLAFHSRDLKQILAYSTISVLGTLVMLLGVGTKEAIVAAMVMLLAHALYKAALFFVAGAIDHETGTRDLDQLRGLWRIMPGTAVAAALAGLSMAGFAPFLGFISKEEVYKAAEHAPAAAYLLTSCVVAAKVLLVAVAGLVAVHPFVGRPSATVASAHAAPVLLWFAPLVVGLCGLGLGLRPEILSQEFIAPSAGAVRGEPAEAELQLWHGFTTAFLLSLLTLIGGLTVYGARGPLRKFGEAATTWLSLLDLEHAYRGALAGLNWLARQQTRILQNGYLRYYLLTILIASAGLVGFALFKGTKPYEAPEQPEVLVYDVILVALALMAALFTVLSKSQLRSVVGLGAVGYAVAAIFVVYGAPDLAMTQFVVETLSVILLVLVFHKLPEFRSHSSLRGRVRDAVVAVVSGSMLAALLLLALGTREQPPVSDYYVQKSLPAGHGRNIVNVILVDFRALDTLGEITVLATAGAGVYALLKLRRARGERREAQEIRAGGPSP